MSIHTRENTQPVVVVLALSRVGHEAPMTGIRKSHFAELTKRSLSKPLANELTIEPESTMAIGDHRNDVELLRWSGLGVCVADGYPLPSLPRITSRRPILEDCAAIAIEQCVLNRKT